MDKNTKYCPFCRQHKPIEAFDKEGKDRLGKDGSPSRRRMCSQCRWTRRKEKSESLKQSRQQREDNIVNAIIQLSRHDMDRVHFMDRKYFIDKTNAHDEICDIDFEEMRERAIKELLGMGFHRPENLSLPPGRYFIIGDTHGLHTNSKMFDLIKNISNELCVNNVIHIGHLLDDDNHISNCIFDLDNLIVVSRTEEAKLIEDFLVGKDAQDAFAIVREELTIGDYHVCNQDLITDYVRTFIGNLDTEIFPNKTITCSHRHEMDVRSSFRGRSIVMSPGCLCEKHIVKTIKQIDFKAGHTVKLAYHDGFSKYRRMGHLYEYWQHGGIIVEYDGESVSCVPMRIKKIGNEYVTSYFDKIIGSHTVTEPDKKIFINGDIHVTYHDDDALFIQEQVCGDYRPDIFVTLGDTYNCSSLNHHAMDRGGVITDFDLLEEMHSLHFVLKRMAGWANEKYIFFGNHERFMTDFTDKYPQLSKLLDYRLLSGLDELGYNFVDLKDVLEIGGLKLIHGDMKMFGSKGRKIERASRVFGECVMGHIHYPSCRFGCYSVGLSGKMDHDYNEPNASNWTHSFLICNQYKGETFISPIIISDYKTLLNGVKYTSKNSDFSKFTSAKVRLVYDFEK